MRCLLMRHDRLHKNTDKTFLILDLVYSTGIRLYLTFLTDLEKKTELRLMSNQSKKSISIQIWIDLRRLIKVPSMVKLRFRASFTARHAKIRDSIEALLKPIGTILPWGSIEEFYGEIDWEALASRTVVHLIVVVKMSIYENIYDTTEHVYHVCTTKTDCNENKNIVFLQ